MSDESHHTHTHDWFLFVVMYVWVFVLSLFILNAIGYVPYYVDGTVPTVSDTELIATEEVPSTGGSGGDMDTDTNTPVVTRPLELPELPARIRIPSLDRDLSVANPVTTDVEELDRALLESVVRYPGSGLLNEDGNVFIFGHSTGYRTVHNQLFKAFNGIQDLEEGSVIELTTAKNSYIYKVEKVIRTDAADTLVDLSIVPGVRRLTLSTCDSFGKKTSRFVVVAELFQKIPLDQAVEQETKSATPEAE